MTMLRRVLQQPVRVNVARFLATENATRSFRVLGLQQIAIGALDKYCSRP